MRKHIVVDCAIHRGPCVRVSCARGAEAVEIALARVLLVAQEEHVLEKVCKTCEPCQPPDTDCNDGQSPREALRTAGCSNYHVPFGECKKQ